VRAEASRDDQSPEVLAVAVVSPLPSLSHATPIHF
jgi:hypothetical protein